MTTRKFELSPWQAAFHRTALPLRRRASRTLRPSSVMGSSAPHVTVSAEAGASRKPAARAASLLSPEDGRGGAPQKPPRLSTPWCGRTPRASPPHRRPARDDPTPLPGSGRPAGSLGSFPDPRENEAQRAGRVQQSCHQNRVSCALTPASAHRTPPCTPSLHHAHTTHPPRGRVLPCVMGPSPTGTELCTHVC